jgi:hypothetical protein
MCIFMHACAHNDMCIFMHTYAHNDMCIFMHTYAHNDMCIFMHTYAHNNMCIFMHACAHNNMCIFIVAGSNTSTHGKDQCPTPRSQVCVSTHELMLYIYTLKRAILGRIHTHTHTHTYIHTYIHVQKHLKRLPARVLNFIKCCNVMMVTGLAIMVALCSSCQV